MTLCMDSIQLLLFLRACRCRHFLRSWRKNLAEERILVVDDEYLIRWTLQQNLAKEGYEVLLAETGEEALER